MTMLSKILYKYTKPELTVALKKIKILVADTQHFNRMIIERRLNQLGFHRIAPVHCLYDMLKIIEYASTPFDIVVADASFAGEHFNLVEYCMDSSQIKGAFLYASPSSNEILYSGPQQQKVKLSVSALPELHALAQLISVLAVSSRDCIE